MKTTTEQRYTVTAWHGEGRSLFYVIDGHAPEDERPAIVATHVNDRKAAEQDAEAKNAALFALQTTTPADIARETRAKADRAELERRQAAPLIGGQVDTTGDLFDQYQADAPLFAAPTPRTKRVHGAPILPDYMTEHPPYPCGLKVGDRVTYTNDAGGMFTGHIIRGFSRTIDHGGRFVYLMPRPGSAHWFAHSPESLEKETRP